MNVIFASQKIINLNTLQMKKVLKFAGVALMSIVLMTSCEREISMEEIAVQEEAQSNENAGSEKGVSGCNITFNNPSANGEFLYSHRSDLLNIFNSCFTESLSRGCSWWNNFNGTANYQYTYYTAEAQPHGFNYCYYNESTLNLKKNLIGNGIMEDRPGNNYKLVGVTEHQVQNLGYPYGWRVVYKAQWRRFICQMTAPKK